MLTILAGFMILAGIWTIVVRSKSSPFVEIEERSPGLVKKIEIGWILLWILLLIYSLSFQHV